MIRKFVNRKSELSFLEERWKSNKFELIVIYGRRRIGKTELIKQFIKDKPNIYFLCDKRGTFDNISRFKKQISKFLQKPIIATNDLEEIFDYLLRETKGKRIVVIFDEFSYLVEKDDSIPSVFQRAVDNLLRNSNMFLILCGSSMSMMEIGVLSGKSPLYGRKTGHIKLEKLPFYSYFEFYPKNKIEKNIEFYAITGGIPFYMEKFSENRSTFENVKKEIASKNGRLFEEIDFLLREEFREPEVYKKIIEAISFGNSRTVNISNYTGISANKLWKYLNSLINLRIVGKDCPITEKKIKTKKTIYFIKDNFFDFYMAFVEPFKSDLMIDELFDFENNFKKNFNQFVGKKFEKLVREELVRIIFRNRFGKFGRWWQKDKEIDVVALNELEKKILFVECKWKNKVHVDDILSKLIEKAKDVRWYNEKREEFFCIFAKSFKRKIEEFKGRKVYCFDLEDLTEIFHYQKERND